MDLIDLSPTNTSFVLDIQVYFIMTCIAKLALFHTVLDLILYYCRLMVIGTLHSGSIPLLAKADRQSQTAFQQDSNTHLETVGDNSDIFILNSLSILNIWGTSVQPLTAIWCV